MTTVAWLFVLVIVAAAMFVFGVWWTKRHPNESQRYYADFEQSRANIEAVVKQQTDKLGTVVDTLDQRITTVEKSAATVGTVATELQLMLTDIKAVLVHLGATPENPAAIITDPAAKK